MENNGISCLVSHEVSPLPCTRVPVALGILYQSAELVALTAAGDKGCQNEITFPLEKPFTGQHS